MQICTYYKKLLRKKKAERVTNLFKFCENAGRLELKIFATTLSLVVNYFVTFKSSN